MFDKIRKAICDVANWICIISLFLIVIVLLIVVIGRYFFQYTPSWAEEFSLFLLTWVGLFSSCIAENRGTHVRVTVMDTILPPVVLRVFGIIRWALKIVFFCFMTYYGYKIFTTTKQTFGAIDLSYKWMVLPGLLTGLFSLVFTLLSTKSVFLDRHLDDSQKDLEILKDE